MKISDQTENEMTSAMHGVDLYTRDEFTNWRKIYPHDTRYGYKRAEDEWWREIVSELVSECDLFRDNPNEVCQSVGEDEQLNEGLQQWRNGDDMLEEEEDESPFDVSSPGFKMMKDMGWMESMPLGITGVGIMEPVSSSMDAKLDGDTTGIGYEKITTDFTPIGEKVRTELIISNVNDKFGIASSDEGQIFVPNGVIKHLKNMRRSSGDRSGVLKGLTIDAIIVRGEGRFPWRLVRVIECIGRLFEIDPNQEWVYGGTK